MVDRQLKTGRSEAAECVRSDDRRAEERGLAAVALERFAMRRENDLRGK